MRLPRVARKRWPPKLQRAVLEVLEEGGSLEMSMGSHFLVLDAGKRRMATIASSSSDHRSYLNALTDLRKARAR